MPRAIDEERQQLEYSGKKGSHTNKNLLAASEKGQVLYLSPTVAGSLHDKALADELELEFMAGLRLLVDLGFLGNKPKDAQVFLSKKSQAKANCQIIKRLKISYWPV